jgi:hypothetical protein
MHSSTPALTALDVAPSPVARPVAEARGRRESRALIDAPRWLLLASLVFAPWAYGSTRPWAVQTLTVLLLLITGAWLVGCLARRRWPQVPVTAVVVAGGLLLHGWWMALNARSVFEPLYQVLDPMPPLIPSAPGSADGALSLASMLLFTGLLGVLLLVCDLCRRPVWRKRIWWTMALTGVSVAAFGLAQKIGGHSVLSLTWDADKLDAGSNFAMFRYRGNAGAYLNLTLPLVAGLTFLALRKSKQSWRKTAWLSALCLVAGGIQLNPSRACWIIALGVIVALAGKVFGHYWRRRHGEFSTGQVLGGATIMVALLLTAGWIFLSGGWQTGWQRIGYAGINPTGRSPTEVYRQMVADAGVCGFGPGTFQAVFPGYQRDYDFGSRLVPGLWVKGRWFHAHQDYFQTVIEWGWLGAAFWALLVFGGIGVAVASYFRRGTEQAQRWLWFCSVLALGGVLVHALVDFPFQIASLQLYIAVLLGICWSGNSAQARASELTQQECR